MSELRLYGREAIDWTTKGDGVWSVDYDLIREREGVPKDDLYEHIEQLFGGWADDPFYDDAEGERPDSVVNRMLEKYGARVVYFDGVSPTPEEDERVFLDWMRGLLREGELEVEVGATDLECPFEYNRATWLARRLIEKGELVRVSAGNYSLARTLKVAAGSALCDDCDIRNYHEDSLLHVECARKLRDAIDAALAKAGSSPAP